jgi:hypothetical protein
MTIAKEANDEGPKFELDKLWDRPEHPEYFFFRIDLRFCLKSINNKKEQKKL